MNNVYIAGVGMTPFGKHTGIGVYELIAQAVNAAVKDSGAELRDIESVYYGTLTHGMLQGQYCVPGPIAMRRMGLQDIPIFTVENACASGSSALHLAAQALRAENEHP